jgi:hypothetical protein
MMSGVTYYTVSYHMQPIAHFKLHAAALRFMESDKKRRLDELAEERSYLTDSENRSKLSSIMHALVVREINIKFEDGRGFEEDKFKQ